MTTLSVTAESADDDCEVESLLKLELDLDADVPRIETLFQLESYCGMAGALGEFWQALAQGAAHSICLDAPLDSADWSASIAALKARRYREWGQTTFETAEAAICGEVNLFFSSVFNEREDDMVATKPKPKAKEKPIQKTDDGVCGACQGSGFVDSTKQPSKPGVGFQCMQCSGTGVSNPTRLEIIAEAERFAVIKRNGKAPAKQVVEDTNPDMTLEDDDEDEAALPSVPSPSKNGKVSTSDKPIKTRSTGPHVRQPMELDLRRVVDSPFQTREEPSDESIEELAGSMAKDGQRDPIRVREVGTKLELLAGHRRTRAARRLHWDVIIGVIEEADDARASFEVYDDNERREGLNQIERALGLKTVWEQYQAAGKSMDQMATDLGVDQSTISNRIRLLAAPQSLQQRLISGEISEARLRSLATWANRGDLLGRFEDELNNRCRSGPVSTHHWTAALWSAIKSVSRTMVKSQWGNDGPLFDAGNHAAELDIVNVKVEGDTRSERRAFNVKLWKKLQDEAKKKRADREKKKEADLKAGKTPTKRTNRDDYSFREGLRSAWNRPIWDAVGQKVLDPKLTKPLKAVAARLISFLSVTDEWSIHQQTITEQAHIEECLAMIKKKWADSLPWNIERKALFSLAEFWQVDIASTWKPTGELLDACELIDLRDLAVELGVQSDGSKSDLISYLLACWPAGHVPDLFSPLPRPKAKSKAAPKKKAAKR